MLDNTQTADSRPAAIPDRRPLPVPLNLIFPTQMLLVLGSCVLVAVLPRYFTAEETEIVTYTAPKEAARKPPAAATTAAGEPGRLWGVIVPLETNVWYFKLTGPIDDVKQHEPQLRDFMRTVTFVKEIPEWTLPDDWKQKPGNDIRFATLLVPGEKKPMELTVIKLPRNGPLDKLLLDNVNRWRDQITLPALTAEQLQGETERLTVAGVESTVVSLEGVLKPSSMTRPPFAR